MSFLASNNSITIKDGSTEMFNTEDKMPAIYKVIDATLTAPAFEPREETYREDSFILDSNIDPNTDFILARSSAQERTGFGGNTQMNTNGSIILTIRYDGFSGGITLFSQYQIGDLIVSDTNLVWKVRTVTDNSVGLSYSEESFSAKIFLGVYS